MSGSTSVAHIARWDGTEWQPVGTGIGGGVFALAAYPTGGSTMLIAGGLFSTAGGSAKPQNIAQYNGSAWSAMGTGLTA